jgi:hypothetical protein
VDDTDDLDRSGDRHGLYSPGRMRRDLHKGCLNARQVTDGQHPSLRRLGNALDASPILTDRQGGIGIQTRQRPLGLAVEL